jgi:hypothetical protein
MFMYFITGFPAAIRKLPVVCLLSFYFCLVTFVFPRPQKVSLTTNSLD